MINDKFKETRLNNIQKIMRMQLVVVFGTGIIVIKDYLMKKYLCIFNFNYIIRKII